MKTQNRSRASQKRPLSVKIHILLKQQLKDEKIDQSENHVIALERETGSQHSKKKRRLENDGEKQVSEMKTKAEEILILTQENKNLKKQA